MVDALLDGNNGASESVLNSSYLAGLAVNAVVEIVAAVFEFALAIVPPDSKNDEIPTFADLIEIYLYFFL